MKKNSPFQLIFLAIFFLAGILSASSKNDACESRSKTALRGADARHWAKVNGPAFRRVGEPSTGRSPSPENRFGRALADGHEKDHLPAPAERRAGGPAADRHPDPSDPCRPSTRTVEPAGPRPVVRAEVGQLASLPGWPGQRETLAAQTRSRARQAEKQITFALALTLSPTDGEKFVSAFRFPLFLK